MSVLDYTNLQTLIISKKMKTVTKYIIKNNRDSNNIFKMFFYANTTGR